MVIVRVCVRECQFALAIMGMVVRTEGGRMFPSPGGSQAAGPPAYARMSRAAASLAHVSRFVLLLNG